MLNLIRYFRTDKKKFCPILITTSSGRRAAFPEGTRIQESGENSWLILKADSDIIMAEFFDIESIQYNVWLFRDSLI